MGNVLLLGRSTNIAPLLITTLSPLTGTSANSVYFQQMTATGGIAPYTWIRSNFRVNGGPQVTPWFGINQNTGLISGMAPNDSELDTFTVTVTDFLGHSVSANFSLQVTSSGSLIITTNLLVGALTGIGYASAPLGASGGTAPYVWNLVGAAPNYDMWLRCDGAKLYGIAQMVETESVTIRVRDSAGATATTTLALAVTASGALAISSPAGMTVAQYYAASPILGTAYALRMLAQGGQPPYRWAFSGPAFAVVGASGTNYQLPFDGWLQGATNGTSADSLTAVCTDNNGATVTQSVTLTNLAAAGNLTFMPLDTTDGGLPLLNMPSAYVGTPFIYPLQVAGGSGSGRVFSVSSGVLPAGLALSAAGVISGAPTQTGASNSCIVKCVDSTNATATAHLYFNIDVANKGVRPAYNGGTGLYVDAGGILRDSKDYLFQFRGMDRTHFDSAGWAGPANGALARPGAVRTNYFNLGLTPAQIAANFVAQHINNNQVPVLMYGYYPGGVQVTGTSDIARFASNCLTDWVNAFGAFQPYLNSIIVNIANEWGPGSSTAWQNAYQAVFANISAISGTTITVNTVSGSNPFANCPLAYIAGAGGIASQVVTLSSPAGSSGAWTVQSSVSFSGYTGGGTLNGGAVAILRAVGYTCPLMIDTGSSGEDLWDIVNYSVAINNSDPRKSCIFSLHPYQSAHPWQAIVHSVTIGNPTVLTLLSNWADFPLNPGASSAGNDNFNDHYQITGALGLTSLNGIQPSDVHTFGSAGNWQVHLTVDSSGWTGTYTADSATLVPASTNSRQAHFNYVFAQLAALRASGVCAVMGEFGPGNQSGNVLTPEGSLNNQQATPGELICAAEANAIPWMGWAWDDHNPNTTAFSGNWFNMTFGNNGVYSKPTDLTAFGVDAVTNPRYGLWAMAQPAPSFLPPPPLNPLNLPRVTAATPLLAFLGSFKVPSAFNFGGGGMFVSGSTMYVNAISGAPPKVGALTLPAITPGSGSWTTPSTSGGNGTATTLYGPVTIPGSYNDSGPYAGNLSASGSLLYSGSVYYTVGEFYDAANTQIGRLFCTASPNLSSIGQPCNISVASGVASHLFAGPMNLVPAVWQPILGGPAYVCGGCGLGAFGTICNGFGFSVFNPTQITLAGGSTVTLTEKLNYFNQGALLPQPKNLMGRSPNGPYPLTGSPPTFVGNLTSGSKVITGITTVNWPEWLNPSFPQQYKTLTDTAGVIPAGAYVTATSNTLGTVTMSVAATGNATTDTMTLTMKGDDYVSESDGQIGCGFIAPGSCSLLYISIHQYGPQGAGGEFGGTGCAPGASSSNDAAIAPDTHNYRRLQISAYDLNDVVNAAAPYTPTPYAWWEVPNWETIFGKYCIGIAADGAVPGIFAFDYTTNLLYGCAGFAGGGIVYVWQVNSL